MNSMIEESSSMISTSTRMVRNGNDAVQTQRSRFYLWFFGLIHVKRLIVCMLLSLTMFAFSILFAVSNPFFSTIPVPGFDGKPAFTLRELRNIRERSASINIVEDPTTIVQVPADKLAVDSAPANTRRTLLLFLAYWYLFSVIMGVLSLRWANRVWICFPTHQCKFFNPAVLLIPFLLSMMSFGVPLLFWTVRSWGDFIDQHCRLNNPLHDCKSIGFIWSMIVCIAVPSLFMCASFFYLIYGCALGFVYIWRRSSAGWRSRDTPAESLNWTFKDKPSTMERSGCLSSNHGHTGSFHRPLVSIRSKNASRPRLTGFTNLNSEVELQSNVLPEESGRGDFGELRQDPYNKNATMESLLEIIPEEETDGRSPYSV